MRLEKFSDGRHPPPADLQRHVDLAAAELRELLLSCSAGLNSSAVVFELQRTLDVLEASR